MLLHDRHFVVQADSGHHSSSHAGAPPAWLDVLGSGTVMPEPLLLVKKDEGGGEDSDKVDVCHLLPNGKFITQRLPEKTSLKLIEGHPHEWIFGKCDDVISPA